MAERLPVGMGRSIKSPLFTSFGSSPDSNDVSTIDRLNGQITCEEPDMNGLHNQLLLNGSSITSNRIAGHNKQSHLEATTKNGSRTKEGESRHEAEWVEQDEPGVYITLTSQPGGIKDLKRVRFRCVVLRPGWLFKSYPNVSDQLDCIVSGYMPRLTLLIAYCPFVSITF